MISRLKARKNRNKQAKSWHYIYVKFPMRLREINDLRAARRLQAGEALLVLGDDGTFSEVRVPNVSSFGHLHAADGVMWSFGTLQLAWTDDAKTWNIEDPRRP